MKIVSTDKDRHDRDHNIFSVSDNGIDFEEPVSETVSAELILPAEEESEG